MTVATIPILFKIPDKKRLSIKPGEIHLWLGRMNPTPKLDSRQTLSDLEVDRANMYRRQADRRNFIARRVYLRLILGHYLDIAPNDISISYSKNGKPELDSLHHPHLSFNLARTDSIALYAFAAAGQLGVDVEEIHSIPEATQILRQYFSREQQVEYANIPPEERDGLFLKWWTDREAYLKGRGDGLPGMESMNASNFDPSRWTGISFLINPNNIAALSYKGEIKQISAWEIPGAWIEELS